MPSLNKKASMQPAGSAEMLAQSIKSLGEKFFELASSPSQMLKSSRLHQQNARQSLVAAKLLDSKITELLYTVLDSNVISREDRERFHREAVGLREQLNIQIQTYLHLLTNTPIHQVSLSARFKFSTLTEKTALPDYENTAYASDKNEYNPR